MIYGAIEAGGTKMICATAKADGTILDRATFPTLTPEETIPQMVAFFQDKEIAALGIACFGPIELHRESPAYGCITTTPKTAWRNYNIVKPFQEALQVPIGFDTDVNGSVLGEVTFGTARGLENVVYFTIGTGIGAGMVVNGKLLHGMTHPEAGHMLLRQEGSDSFQGCCPSHGTCFEGLASGPAIEARYGKKAQLLVDRPEVWALEAAYIAQALANIVVTVSPERIILGGGVMQQTQLFALIRTKLLQNLNGYIQSEKLLHIDTYVTQASLNGDQGILGAIQLAIEAGKA